MYKSLPREARLSALSSPETVEFKLTTGTADSQHDHIAEVPTRCPSIPNRTD